MCLNPIGINHYYKLRTFRDFKEFVYKQEVLNLFKIVLIELKERKEKHKINVMHNDHVIITSEYTLNMIFNIALQNIVVF